ncbi:cytochrome P450 monooxygenase pc-3 [Desarmillaria tabescens]|uniref:Cytochrome P450 monooxygenase pc-3 n=1 Tax=Armillaria tabescens TaxID=1929756 RepID=A0AA39KCL9_ARMTA|nr:cytochrome P450 monooxygenase pc-3 [Desarmillaria tabescens]KAK0458665.1 cytochrome P450 monooxygenase pc-3 [Desarmillaria tabescens]
MVMTYSPGLGYLCRASLSIIIFPCAAFWALQSVLIKFSFNIPVWVVLVVPLALQFAIHLLGALTTNFTVGKEATSRGALRLPRVQESSIAILQRVVHSFKNGYPSEVFHEWSQKYGNTFSFGAFSDRQVFTSEPDHLKAFLATQFQDFEKGPFVINAAKSFVGTGVFNSDGAILHRTMTRPFFNKDRISDFDNFERHASSTITQIKARLREGHTVDFQDVVARFTLDSATEFLFGKDVESISSGLPYPTGSPLAGDLHFVNHPSNVFVTAIARASEHSMTRLRRGPFWPLYELLSDKVKPHRRVMDNFVQPMITEALDRKAKGIKFAGSEKTLENMSLLDRLVEDIDDPKVVQDELINVLVASRDTTSSLLTSVVYMLCEHPDMANRLRSEILEKVGTRRPTYEDVRDMKYLRAFLNETLRLYTPVPENSRTSKVATTIPNKGRAPYYVPKDTTMLYSFFLMHRRTDLWGPDALEFDPDRFLDSRVHKYLTPNPYIFLPFNAGPRICLGQQFAYNEASYYLIRLLQNFSSFNLALDVQPPEGIPPKSWTHAPGTTKGREKIMFGVHITLFVKGGLWVRMKEAKDG